MKRIFLTAIISLAFLFASKGQSLKDIFISKDFSKLKTYIANKGVNTPDRGYYPIVVAAKFGDAKIVQELINEGADINARGFQKRTALMVAAKNNHKDVGLLLVRNRANLILKDVSGATAYDIAIKSGHKDFAEEVIRANLHLYAGTDGPYIFQEGGQYKAYYTLPKAGSIQTAVETVDPSRIALHDFHCHDAKGNTLFSFNVNDTEQIYPDTYDDNEAIYAISDIEGNLPALVNLLKAGGVMNSQYQWSFGSGHLVLVGDFFDRGDQVTECLWLIYKLEQEARRRGGKVHFIIGNHELMNLSGDIRFARTKYKSNARLMGKSYHALYGENTVLGRWLRTKPAMLRIRDILFVHAGLSTTFLKHKLDIGTINETMMTSIDLPKEKRTGLAAKVLGKEGPLWYRGIARNKIAASELDAILSYYQSKTIIIGHTKVDNIETTHSGKVINLDVPHEKGSKYQQGLLINGNTFYSVNTTGRKTTVK